MCRIAICPYLTLAWGDVRARSRLRKLPDADILSIWKALRAEAIARGIPISNVTPYRLDNPYMTEDARELLYGMRVRNCIQIAARRPRAA